MPSSVQSPRKAKHPGDVIRDLREDIGLSPEQLGAQAGVSGDTIRRLEAKLGPRHPHPRTKFLLADAFGQRVRDIWVPGS